MCTIQGLKRRLLVEPGHFVAGPFAPGTIRSKEHIRHWTIRTKNQSLQGIFATGPLATGPFVSRTLRHQIIHPKDLSLPDHLPHELFPAGPFGPRAFPRRTIRPKSFSPPDHSPQGLFPVGRFASKSIQFLRPQTRPKYHTTVRYEPVYVHTHTHLSLIHI